MAGRTKGFFHFESINATGIAEVPNNSLVYIEKDSSYLQAFFIKINNTGLTSGSTLQDAITNNNIELLNSYGAGLQHNNLAPRRNELVGPEEYASLTGGVIKLIVDDSNPTKPIMYMTNNGTDPVVVPTGTGRPETYVNSGNKLREWHMKTSQGSFDLFEVYLNGSLVYRKVLELFLPNPSNNTAINLRSFINANNPDNYKVINVYNQYIQPTVISGDLSGLEVSLINLNEIQGSSSGSDALIIQSNMYLDNQGWIRGAGGRGGTGGKTPDLVENLGGWEGRGSYDDGTRDTPALHPSPCVPGGSTDFFNRFYNATHNLHGWVQTGCTNQSYVSSGLTTWGDQTNVLSADHSVKVGGSTTPKFGNGFSDSGYRQMYIRNTANRVTHGGVGGNGGAGARWQSQGASSGLGGYNGYESGNINGYNTSTGFATHQNLALYKGGNGGIGGGWGINGSNGSPSGNGTAGGSGQAAGNAISGNIFLTPGSNTGNVN